MKPVLQLRSATHVRLLNIVKIARALGVTASRLLMGIQ